MEAELKILLNLLTKRESLDDFLSRLERPVLVDGVEKTFHSTQTYLDLDAKCFAMRYILGKRAFSKSDAAFLRQRIKSVESARDRKAPTPKPNSFSKLIEDIDGNVSEFDDEEKNATRLFIDSYIAKEAETDPR